MDCTLSLNISEIDFLKLSKAEINEFWDNILWGEGVLRKLASFHRNKKSKINFLKLLVTERQLFSSIRGKGGQLISTVAAKKIAVTPMSICTYLNELESLGLIQITNNKWAVGLKSREWRVICPVLREIQLAVQGADMPNKLKESSLKTVSALKDDIKRQKIWDKLALIESTTLLDNQGQVTVSMGSDKLKQEIKKLVFLYQAKEFNLLYDFAIHMFHNRNIYSEDRKRYMAWYFEDCMSISRDNAALTKEHYLDAAFIQVTDDFTFKSEVVRNVISKVLKSRQSEVVIQNFKIKKWKDIDRETIAVKPILPVWDTRRVNLTRDREKLVKPQSKEERKLTNRKIVTSSFHNLAGRNSEPLINV